MQGWSVVYDSISLVGTDAPHSLNMLAIFRASYGAWSWCSSLLLARRKCTSHMRMGFTHHMQIDAWKDSPANFICDAANQPVLLSSQWNTLQGSNFCGSPQGPRQLRRVFPAAFIVYPPSACVFRRHKPAPRHPCNSQEVPHRKSPKSATVEESDI